MKRSHVILAAVLAVAASAGYAVYENTAVTLTNYTVRSDKLPEDFPGLKICHLSDIHVKTNPQNYGRMIKLAAEMKPDIIAISGDLIDSRASDFDAAASIVETLCEIAPVYYVTGNHEEHLPTELYFKALEALQAAGAHILDGNSETFIKGGVKINIAGMSDREYPSVDGIKELCREDRFNVFICHRPQFIGLYAEAGADLSLCGHAHGGQARLPFLGGVIAPDQGFFPEFYEGLHDNNGRFAVISRGIGNSIVPVRVNNRPEVVGMEVLGG